MKRIPVSSEPLQEQSFDFAGRRLRLTLRYNSIGDHWAFDLLDESDNTWLAQGLTLVVGVPMLWRSTLPFFLWLDDLSGVGLDPMGGKDMGSRCLLYIGEKSEVRP
ncbi:phage baseplate plug family protein [Pseudomonas solani]|uniref:phage baseplate plug family protein n=1 Tax=Pseudomonas solani TaxID=2731552 RepID=UPI003C2CFEF0